MSEEKVCGDDVMCPTYVCTQARLKSELARDKMAECKVCKTPYYFETECPVCKPMKDKFEEVIEKHLISLQEEATTKWSSEEEKKKALIELKLLEELKKELGL